MARPWSRLALGCLMSGLAVTVVAAHAGASRRPAQESHGWTIPPDAARLESPVPGDASVVARGRRLYESRCRRCHGPSGRGDGPEAERDEPPGDLADPARAARNPDGVVFYKVWNGRRSPRMPAFKTELSRDEVWAVVHYVKTLRRGAGDRSR